MPSLISTPLECNTQHMCIGQSQHMYIGLITATVISKVTLGEVECNAGKEISNNFVLLYFQKVMILDRSSPEVKLFPKLLHFLRRNASWANSSFQEFQPSKSFLLHSQKLFVSGTKFKQVGSLKEVSRQRRAIHQIRTIVVARL